MNDEELIEALRRTLHSRAAAVRPKSAPTTPEPGAAKRPERRVWRPWALAGLGVAAAAAAGVAVTLGLSEPNHASITTANSATTQSPPSTASAVTSPPPTAAPATSTPTTPSLPAVPSGFRPVSATYVSPHTGWALGTVPCGSSLCASLARTSDNGRHWGSVTAPVITFSDQQAVADTWVRFVNSDDGWIMTPTTSGTSNVFYTEDGGRNWQPVATPGGSTATVLALEAAIDQVYAVVAVPGTPGDEVFTSPQGVPDWKATGTVPRSGGPVPTADIALYGSSGWIIGNDRTTSGGAVLGADGTWTSWSPPCLTANGPGLVAASSTSDVSVVCDEGAWGPSSGNLQGDWLFSSSDGGRTFAKVAAVPGQVTSLTSAAGNPLTMVAATNGGLEASFDGGKNWQTVYSAGGQFDQTFVGFTTGTQGVATLQAADGSSTLLMTYDGGHTWSPASF
jgi:photosystem II stability/assembly factor-like uncharacterized protein